MKYFPPIVFLIMIQLNLIQELNRNYEEFNLKFELFPTPKVPYSKFVLKETERKKEFLEWFEFHDKIVEKLQNPIKEFQNNQILTSKTIKRKEFESNFDEIPFPLCLEYYTKSSEEKWKFIKNSSQKYFNQLICNQNESIISILGRNFLIPKNSSFFLSSISNGKEFLNQLNCKKFQFIFMDPPWQNKSVNRGNQYQQFNHENLLNIPFNQLKDEYKGGYIAVMKINLKF
jgi:hypothetical protein